MNTLKSIGKSLGEYDELNYVDSLTALYVVKTGSEITSSKYYKHVFMLNGITSFLAHSPLLKNVPTLRRHIGDIDGITIWYPLFMHSFKVKYNLTDEICDKLLVLVITLNYVSDNNVSKVLLNILPLSSILLIYTIKDNITLQVILTIVLPALLTKIYEKKQIVPGVNVHCIWHILGANMFKTLVVDSSPRKKKFTLI